MNILIVTNMFPSEEHPYHGIFVKEQIHTIQRLHNDVHFDVYAINGFGGKWQYVKSMWEISHKINNGSYDLVHLHSGFAGMYMYWPFLKKVRTLVTFHGSDIQPQSNSGFFSTTISKHAARYADSVIILNENMKAIVQPLCKNVYMIPCGVDMQIFRETKANAHKNTVVVFPSSSERRVKNYPLFCETINILKERYCIDIHEIQLKNMTRMQIAETYSNSDVLLMTSKSEGSPQAIKEAMCCNLPCVSTPVGDVKVLLDGVKDSYVSTRHDANELAKLVVKSLKHDGKGISGREKAIKLRISEETVADDVYALYQKLVIGRNYGKTK